MTVIAYAFPKLQTTKDLVRPISKKPRFRTPFNSQHVKGYQTLVESVRQHFYQISSSLWAKLAWKMFLLVICKMLGHFVNTLTADDKYFLFYFFICLFFHFLEHKYSFNIKTQYLSREKTKITLQEVRNAGNSKKLQRFIIENRISYQNC